ncbi:MAG: hypothetical protein AB1813_24455 [Verrucomicrobiota bacterium]
MFYWTIGSSPEMRNLDPALRARVWRQCYLLPFADWQTWVAFVVGPTFFMIAGSVLGGIIDTTHPEWHPQLIRDVEPPLFWFLGALGGAAIGALGWISYYAQRVRPYVRAYLAAQHGILC